MIAIIIIKDEMKYIIITNKHYKKIIKNINEPKYLILNKVKTKCCKILQYADRHHHYIDRILYAISMPTRIILSNSYKN